MPFWGLLAVGYQKLIWAQGTALLAARPVPTTNPVFSSFSLGLSFLIYKMG